MVTPILFEKIITKPGQSADFVEEKRAVFEKASLSCLPSVIRMGLGITQGHLQEHVSVFRDKLVYQADFQAYIVAITILRTKWVPFLLLSITDIYV